MNKTAKGFLRILSILISSALLCTGLPISAAPADETPEATYTGLQNAGGILNNLDYTDIKNSKSWAAEAAYEAGALGILKGYGAKQFGLGRTLSKTEALAVAYNAAGREAEAQKAGEALDQARLPSNKKADTIEVWADGYLQLAVNEGLITRQQYNDAMSSDQAGLSSDAFKRNAPAARQEMAFWLSKTLKLDPVYTEQVVFNSYKDWRQADPLKVPYIEAVLKSGIMNGSDGYFRPVQAVTREQGAQIVRNAEAMILKLLGVEKKTGAIESITPMFDYSEGKNDNISSIDIRSSNGKLHVVNAYGTDASGKNEQNGAGVSVGSLGLVVYKNGVLGGSNLLKTGDRLEYYVDSDGRVVFVKVLSNKNDTKYIAAHISKVDTAQKKLTVTQIMKLDYPDINLVNESSNLNPGSESLQVYTWSSGAGIFEDGKKRDVSVLAPDVDVILELNSSNTVTMIYTADFSMDAGIRNIVSGIVQDINSSLGYITLYSTGKAYPGGKGTPVLKTFNYVNPNDMSIYRNNRTAVLDDIEPGDTAFLKLDEDQLVTSISAVDNYGYKYAKVISRTLSSLAVRYDDNTQQVLSVDEGIPVIAGGKLADISDVQDGDRVRLLLGRSGNFISVKEITIEGEERYISNIYKGTITYIDPVESRAAVANMEVFENGKWARTGRKGITSVKLADECGYFSAGGKLYPERLGSAIRNNQAYIAVEEDYGGEEQAIAVSFRNERDTEVVYNDSVNSSVPGSGSFELGSLTEDINYNDGSIIVKNGRLVTGGSINDSDSADVVANRSYNDGAYRAGIVVISDVPAAGLFEIYRGRIKGINDNTDFTLESFSRLSGIGWEYSNTPKTFDLAFDTRILGDDGVVGQRDFTSYGTESYKGRVVYVVAADSKTVLVSTAPYGNVNVRGEIYSTSGGTVGEEGTLLEEPTELNLRGVMVYDQARRLWATSPDMTLDLPVNCIIMKNGREIKPSELKKGDRVRVIKKDPTTSGEAYIILIEN